MKHCLKKFTNSVVAGALIFNFSSAPFMSSLQKQIVDRFLSSVSTDVVLAETRVNVVATAYTASVDETDENPWETASGERVRDGIIAANFLPFGTRVKIPELFGDKVLVVKDRMNKRYTKAVPLRIDIYVADKKTARKFGVKEAEMIILPDEVAEEALYPHA